VHDIRGGRPVVDPALGWSAGLSVQVGGAGTVAHAGVVLPRLLGDWVGLTTALSRVLARAGFIPVRHRGRALTDAACALAAGATCLSDIEAMTRQVEIFGPDGGASDTTMPRVLDELAGGSAPMVCRGGGWPRRSPVRGGTPGRRSWPDTGRCRRCGSPGPT